MQQSRAGDLPCLLQVGGLRDIADRAKVKPKMLFPTENGEVVLRIAGVTSAQDAEAGSITRLLLVNEHVFGIRGMDLTKPDPFYNAVRDTVPETVA